MMRGTAAAGITLSAVLGMILRGVVRSRPRNAGKMALPGLEGMVEVDYDQWGVPHIRAGNLDDLLYAQGFVTAQDRMIQMEKMRRVAEGRTAEIMGGRALWLDIFMRNMGLNRSAEAILGGLPADSRSYLDHYTSGVNAYLERRRKSLPPELVFTAKGRPRPWSPESALVVELLIAWSLDATWRADLMRGRLVRKLGWNEAERLLDPRGSSNRPVLQLERDTPPLPGIDPPPECDLPFLGENEMSPPWITNEVDSHIRGSNNWVIGGGMTRSGFPLLCNDPHTLHAIPTLFYLCHLRSEDPQYNVIGASCPGIPGVLLGRNENLAWGATGLFADVVDLYVEAFESETSLSYRVGDGWREADVFDEEIRILGGRKVSHRVELTRHGPVVARVGDRGLALKWAGHEPENDSAGCLVRIGLARNWNDFSESLRGYAGPSLNLVYADVEGNIGYRAAGRIPLRKGHDGSVPLPGPGEEYEWQGFVPFEELPAVLNPGRGWVATANNQVVEGRGSQLITTMWEPSTRQGRIADLISSREDHDVEGMREMQSDIYSPRGALLRDGLLEAAAVHDGLPARTREALDILRDWDCRADTESVAQTLAYMSWRVLTERILRHRLGHSLYFDYTTSFLSVPQAVECLLMERPDGWLPPFAASYDELLLQCLEEAMVRLDMRYRSMDIGSWRWGRLHTLRIPHHIRLPFPLRGLLDLGPIQCGGDGGTVCCSFPESDPAVQLMARSFMGANARLSSRPSFWSDEVYAGATLRMIVDLSDAGTSLWCLDVGQSSHRLSPFYKNFLHLWRSGGYAPMAFTDKEIEEMSRRTLLLKPGVQSGECVEVAARGYWRRRVGS